MTFATRTMFAMSQGAPIPFTPDVSNNSASTGIRSGQLSLSSDGTGAHTVANVSTPLAWYAPAPTVGAGSGIWVKLTVNSTSSTNITGAATGTVLTLGATWTFTSTSPAQEGFGTFTLTFYSDAGGTSVIRSQSGAWDVGYTP